MQTFSGICQRLVALLFNCAADIRNWSGISGSNF